MTKMAKIIKYVTKRIKVPVLNIYKKPNKNAIWIFGFQKAGTSAIAGLFAKMSGKSVTIDTVFLWGSYKAKMNKTGIAKHVNKYSYDFSKDIIKEPGATFYIPTIESYFKLEKYIFIVRNPYDNIRSILNRLKVAGNKEQIDLSNIDLKWRSKFKNGGENYVQDLAELWLRANNQKEYMHNHRCVLVKYEDFVYDKVGFIEKLITEFNLDKVNDISDIMNNQFQPKGNSKTSLMDFFGSKNIDTIDRICGVRMRELGYNRNEILNL